MKLRIPFWLVLLSMVLWTPMAAADSFSYRALDHTQRTLSDGTHTVDVEAAITDVRMPSYTSRDTVVRQLETKLSNYGYRVAREVRDDLGLRRVSYDRNSLRISDMQIDRNSNGNYVGRSVRGRFTLTTSGQRQ